MALYQFSEITILAASCGYLAVGVVSVWLLESLHAQTESSAAAGGAPHAPRGAAKSSTGAFSAETSA
jgi:hypothetical protein